MAGGYPHGLTASGIYGVWWGDEESMTLKRLVITLQVSVRRNTESYMIQQKGLAGSWISLYRVGGDVSVKARAHNDCTMFAGALRHVHHPG